MVANFLGQSNLLRGTVVETSGGPEPVLGVDVDGFRIQVPVGVGYNCDLDLAEKLMLEAAKGAKRVLATPPPVVWQTWRESSTELIFAGDRAGTRAAIATSAAAVMDALRLTRRSSDRESFS